MPEVLSYWVNCICNNCFAEVSYEFLNGTLVELKGRTCTACGCKDTLQRLYPKTLFNPSSAYPQAITLPYITQNGWSICPPIKPPEWTISNTAP
jgi:hypothetical protein